MKCATYKHDNDDIYLYCLHIELLFIHSVRAVAMAVVIFLCSIRAIIVERILRKCVLIY